MIKIVQGMKKRGFLTSRPLRYICRVGVATRVRAVFWVALQISTQETLGSTPARVKPQQTYKKTGHQNLKSVP